MLCIALYILLSINCVVRRHQATVKTVPPRGHLHHKICISTYIYGQLQDIEDIAEDANTQ